MLPGDAPGLQSAARTGIMPRRPQRGLSTREPGMFTPLHGVREPFAPASNIIYIHDWRYVYPGGYRWSADDGAAPGIFSADPVPRLSYEYRDMPLGIRLSVCKARKSEPVLEAEPGDILLMGGSLIHEHGLYRLWYECWPGEMIGSPEMGNHNFVRYAESEDGFTWRFPKLGLVERMGSRDNNIVYGGPLTPETGYHGGCIFRDPSAPPEERYKAFHMGRITPAAFERYIKDRPGEVDANINPRRPYGIFGAVSPDGLRWTPLPDPLVAQSSDTHNVCHYDAARGRYVGYCRSFYFTRRTIGRTETADFRRFPLPEELFWPGAALAPDELWYANARTAMPGAPDHHVMFPLKWQLTRDLFEFHVAASPDGIVWGFVPGGPAAEPSPDQAWDGGVVWPGVGLVDLPGDRTGLLYQGAPVPHKYARRPPFGKLAWAWWPKGRLAALQAPYDGSFRLHSLLFRGRTVRLNFRTRATGFVQVAARGPQGLLHDFADCDPLCGDHLDRVVSWKGRTDLGHPEGAPVTLSFRLRNAELYSVRFD